MVTTKNRGVWQATTKVEIGDNMVLEILTRKWPNKALATTASVMRSEPGSSYMSHIMHQDFSKLIVSTLPSRITAKVVEQQHASVDVDRVIEMVNEFYSLA